MLFRSGYDAATRLPVQAFCLTTGGDVEFWSNPDAAEAYACVNDQERHDRDWVRQALHLERLDLGAALDLLDRAPWPVRRTCSKQLFKMFVARQRAGLSRAVGINSLPDGVSPAMREVLRACASPGASRSYFLLADIAWIAPQPPPENRVLRLFNGSRILWQPPFPPMVGDWESKGTDVLLRGIALWHERTRQPIDVRLVEKGRSEIGRAHV